MNISSNMSSTMMQIQGMGSSQQQQASLTEEQQQKVNEILAEYDAENISQEDFESIFAQFKEEGIPGGQALKSTVEEAGFDFSSNIEEAAASGEMAGMMPPPPPGGMGGMPPPGMQSSTSSEEEDDSSEYDYASQLEELLAAYDNGEADQSDFEALIESIKASGSSSTGNVINSVA